MFKLALYEYYAVMKGYYRKHVWMVVLMIGCLGMTLYNVLISNRFESGSFWLISLGLIIGFSGNEEIEQHFPAIFSYVPLSESERKRYILYRNFVNEIIVIPAALFLALGWTDFLSGMWYGGMLLWMSFVLCRQKNSFYKTYRTLNHGRYYPGMTLIGKIAYWLSRVLDITAICSMVFAGLQQLEIPYFDPDVRLKIVIGCMAYQFIFLIHFIFFVRTAMRRLSLPELIDNSTGGAYEYSD